MDDQASKPKDTEREPEPEEKDSSSMQLLPWKPQMNFRIYNTYAPQETIPEKSSNNDDGTRRTSKTRNVRSSFSVCVCPSSGLKEPFLGETTDFSASRQVEQCGEFGGGSNPSRRHIPSGNTRRRPVEFDARDAQTDEVESFDEMEVQTDEVESNRIDQSDPDRLNRLAGRVVTLIPPRGFPLPRNEEVKKAVDVWYNNDPQQRGNFKVVVFDDERMWFDQHAIQTLRPDHCVNGNFILFFLKYLAKDDGLVIPFACVEELANIFKPELTIEEGFDVMFRWLFECICLKEKRWLIVAINANDMKSSPPDHPGHMVILVTHVPTEEYYFIDPDGDESQYDMSGRKRYLRLRKNLLLEMYRKMRMENEKVTNEFDGSNLQLQHVEHAVQSSGQKNCAIICMMGLKFLLEGKPLSDFENRHVDYARYHITNKFLQWLRSQGIDF